MRRRTAMSAASKCATSTSSPGSPPRSGRQLAVVYVTAVAFTFAFFYPISVGLPLSKPILERRIWFASWR
jgi:dolichyl-phosphate-mannose--protein O-mannosyl transferase